MIIILCVWVCSVCWYICCSRMVWYTFVCVCMPAFSCLCVQLRRPETEVKCLLYLFPLYFWDSLPLYLELTSLVILCGWMLQTCYHTQLPHSTGTGGLNSGPHACNPLYPLRHPPSPSYTFGKTFLCNYYQKHNSQLEPCWFTPLSAEIISENVHRKTRLL